jgi:malate synthase
LTATDKLREVMAGHDGTWVAHPALVRVAKDVFDEHMKAPNQIHSNLGLAGASVTEEDLLRLPQVPLDQAITSDGLQRGIHIVMAYSEAWLRGVGCIPLHNAMEDAATAEISRVQIWQWRSQGLATQDDGFQITKERVTALIQAEVQKQGATQGKWRLAGALVQKMLNGAELDEFLTSVCYPYIVTSAYEGTTPPAKL